MPTLPITLKAGTIAVYGAGRETSTELPTPAGVNWGEDYLMGTVYNIWSGGATYIYPNQVVTWKKGTEVCRIATQENITYTVLPARLVTKDFVVP